MAGPPEEVAAHPDVAHRTVPRRGAGPAPAGGRRGRRSGARTRAAGRLGLLGCPPDVSKRLVLPILALALVAAACSEPPAGRRSTSDRAAVRARRSPTRSTTSASAPPSRYDADGDAVRLLLGASRPSSKKGEIAVPRPIGAPFVPAVLLASPQKGMAPRRRRQSVTRPTRVPVAVGSPRAVETLQERRRTTATAPTSPSGRTAPSTSCGPAADGHLVRATAPPAPSPPRDRSCKPPAEPAGRSIAARDGRQTAPRGWPATVRRRPGRRSRGDAGAWTVEDVRDRRRSIRRRPSRPARPASPRRPTGPSSRTRTRRPAP